MWAVESTPGPWKLTQLCRVIETKKARPGRAPNGRILQVHYWSQAANSAITGA